MNTFALVLLLGATVLTSACQGPPGVNPETQSTASDQTTTSEPVFVQAADGSFYSIPCLRQHAQEIQQTGRSAAQQCATDAAGAISEMASRGETNAQSRYQFFYYYPPSYWTTYYNGLYNYNNPYNSYFCNYLFGISWGSSCYSNILGYSNSYTTATAGGSCYQCYGSSYSPYCYNTCWYGYY